MLRSGLIYAVSGVDLPASVLMSALLASLVISILSAFYMSVTEQLAHDRNQYIERFNLEMEIARKFQMAILPDGEHTLSGVQIGVRYVPYFELSGDIFDIYLLQSGKVRVFLADISGHGVQSSLLGMSLKTYYNNLREEYDSVDTVLEKLNEFFYNKLSLHGQFATAFLIDIDTEEKTLSYSSAGHLPQILVSSLNFRYMKSGGRPLGVVREVHYQRVTVNYNSGDQILLFTDGLTDGLKNENFDDQYRELEKMLRPLLNQKPLTLLNSLIYEVDRMNKSADPLDDIALLSIKL